VSKPLKLTIHPLIQDRLGDDWYVWKDTGIRPHIADMYAGMKRLTAPELAAEYWRAVGDESLISEGYSWEAMCGDWTQSELDSGRRTDSLRRFAVLPHYDEAES
jgi:N-formylglutamate amidohydrolase